MIPENEGPLLEGETDVNPSTELDMVTVFSDTGSMAEMQALTVQGVLEANGIPGEVVGTSTLPVLEFAVTVPRNRYDEALLALADAEASGPAAAEEGERMSEIAGAKPE
jgi:hypothetical protein